PVVVGGVGVEAAIADAAGDGASLVHGERGPDFAAAVAFGGYAVVAVGALLGLGQVGVAPGAEGGGDGVKLRPVHLGGVRAQGARGPAELRVLARRQPEFDS